MSRTQPAKASAAKFECFDGRRQAQVLHRNMRVCYERRVRLGLLLDDSQGRLLSAYLNLPVHRTHSASP